MTAMRVITLLTDFGDFYPGVMKGVILSLAENAVIVDISHSVESQNVFQGAFLLYHSYRYFKNAIHVAVVDPGVGTERRAIAVITNNHIFIAPDNGISFPAASDDGIKKVYEIDESISKLVGELSATFHGRDIFAPAAAMALKGRLEEFCSEMKKMEKLDIFDYEVGRTLKCRVVYVDRFGNLVTNVRGGDVKDAKGFYFEGTEFPLVRTYSDVEEGKPLSVVGSFNTLELSVRNGNAARLLGIEKGDVEIELEVIR
jgi:hypothetical protein